MARIAIYRHAIVQAGCRIELSAPPGLREGDELDVVLLTDNSEDMPSQSLLDILDSLAKGLGTFKSAPEVDQYICDERSSWER